MDHELAVFKKTLKRKSNLKESVVDFFKAMI